MKTIRNIAIGLLSLGLFSPLALAKEYPDLPSTHKHYTSVSSLTDRGIVNGYPEGLFGPDDAINRAEAVKVLIEMKYPHSEIDSALDWHKKAGHSYAIFYDVPINEWYAKYVEVSFQNSVVAGYPDGTFKGGDEINFAEALKVILESYKVDFSQNRFQQNKFLYVNQGDWFEKYFTYAYQHNLINQDKFYHPGQLITRGEFVEVIYRLEEMLKARSSAYTSTETPYSTEYRITIPRLDIINLDVHFANVYDPTAALGILKEGMGHYLNAPDKLQKTVIFGHSSGYASDHSSFKTILREIDKLQPGDRIYVNYNEKGYVYEVKGYDIIAASEDASIIQDEKEHELELFTCWPPDSTRQRYVVNAQPI